MSTIMITLPSLSPTMTEGTIAEWKVKPGDEIESGQVIASIATDKSTVDYESLEEGFLREIILEAGGAAPVGKVIAVFTEEADEDYQADLDAALAEEVANEPEEEVDEDVSDDAPTSSATKAPVSGGAVTATIVPVSAPPAEVPGVGSLSPSAKDIKVSPAARKLAEEKRINLAAVKPATTGDRIVLNDIETLPNGYGASEAQSGSGLVGYVSRASESLSDVPMTQMRQAIANRMVQASAGVPVIYLTTKIEMDRLMDLRAQLNSMEGVRISINDFIVKACGLSLAKFPAMNGAFQGDKIVQFNDIDISVAVSIPDGLITPIVRSADTKGLASISKDVKSLVGKARSNSLSPDEYQGGSFTISNLGMFGAVDSFTAILNPPQSAILAVAGTQEQLKLVNGEVKASKVCKMTITCDHRVIDGALAAEFMNALKDYLETPAKLIV
ncbi:dihydrolipoamide acetyltransferase family protein [Lentisphaera profundi]|uniref:Dihydrolipoamide acetyltransferase component of pyruvate dehydrogenase complex n=1 Tax=Lentisphaera profundi TaxID=1658616 RepID=A0ABY7VV07_9BACT|nr:dihydrolipoamide acetyltransferase family protein [Lentisphaera profundi]WDE95938.1 dihydrolipoamide acetyltransferase family protein [Lentisphaera profundi]